VQAGATDGVDARPPQTHNATARSHQRVWGPLIIGSAGHGHGAGYLDISVKPSPTVRPRWFILYNGLEPFPYWKWRCRSDGERGIRVDVEKSPASAKAS
jgi:hypothetical protein